MSLLININLYAASVTPKRSHFQATNRPSYVLERSTVISKSPLFSLKFLHRADRSLSVITEIDVLWLKRLYLKPCFALLLLFNILHRYLLLPRCSTTNILLNRITYTYFYVNEYLNSVNTHQFYTV